MKEKICQWRLKKSFRDYFERLQKEQNILEIKFDNNKNPKFIQIIMEDKSTK